MRFVLLALALTGLVACGEEESLEVPLQPVGDSGVSGTMIVEETAGKSGFGEVRFGFTVNNPTSRKVVGFIHEGRCASLGLTENVEGLSPDDTRKQIAFVRDGHNFHLQQLDSYRGNHAFAVHAFGVDLEDASGAVLACGDI
jgi:hypothetical protein